MFSRYLRESAGSALALGGLLWIVLYGVVIVIGPGNRQLVSSLDPAHTPALRRIAISTTVGAGFLGGAVWRAHISPLWMAWIFILVCLMTAPLLFATPLPFGPDWASDFLAFLLSGIAYGFVGLRLTATNGSRAESAVSHSIP